MSEEKQARIPGKLALGAKVHGGRRLTNWLVQARIADAAMAEYAASLVRKGYREVAPGVFERRDEAGRLVSTVSF